MKTLTVFTPTYNRAFILGQLYESLKSQTSHDFEWLIIDDGSTDNTKIIVNKWIEEGILPILYYRQINGGKMRAHNLGVKLCKTTLFVCVDSDDYLKCNAVEIIINVWNNYNDKDKISGIVGYKAFVNNINARPTIKCEFPTSGLSTLHGLYQNGFIGDTTLIFRTEIIALYPFPEIEGEKFITEAYSYDQIDQNYQFLLCKEPFTVCAYLPDGYTSNNTKLVRDNPKGWSMYYNQVIKFYWNEMSLKRKLFFLTFYIVMSKRAKESLGNIFKHSENRSIFFIICLLLSLYYSRKINKQFS